MPFDRLFGGSEGEIDYSALPMEGGRYKGYTPEDLEKIWATAQMWKQKNPQQYWATYEDPNNPYLKSEQETLKKAEEWNKYKGYGTSGAEQGPLIEHQQSMADMFEKNIDMFRDQLMGGIQRDARRQMAEGIRAGDRALNRRGLIFSGGRPANQAKQRGAAKAAIEQGRYDTNQQLGEIQRALKQAPINSAMSATKGNQADASMGLTEKHNATLDALNRRNMNNQSLNQFFTGVSRFGGAVA